MAQLAAAHRSRRFDVEESSESEDAEVLPTLQQTRRYCRRCGLHFELLLHLSRHLHSSRHLVRRRLKYQTESESDCIERSAKRAAQCTLPEEPIRKIRRLITEAPGKGRPNDLLEGLPYIVNVGSPPATDHSNGVASEPHQPRLNIN